LTRVRTEFGLGLISRGDVWRILARMNTPRPSLLVQLVLLPVLFFVGAKLSLALALMPGSIVMLWLPNGVLLAALLHFHMRRYGLFAVAILLAEIAADYPTYTFLEAMLFGAINLTEATLAYFLLMRWRFNSTFAGPIDLVKFLGAGPVISACVAATAAGATHIYFRNADITYLQFARVWWFSDGMGLLIVTPLVLSLWPTAAVRDSGSTLRWYDAIAVVLTLAAIGAFLMVENGELAGIRIRPVQLLPFVLYAAARLTPRATTLVLVAVSAAILYVTKNGQQPFGELPVQETVLQVQQIIFIMTISSLGLATLLAQLRANTREIEARVRERTLALHAANEQLQKLAVTDPLTGIANRRALFDTLRHEMERHRRHGHPLAVILFDIDRFKDVNDTYGHAIGDAALKHVAHISQQMIRSTDALARYGGEEFVLIAVETNRTQALQLAERVRDALRNSHVPVDHLGLRVTASFGVAMLRADDTDPEQLLRRADAALYAAKSAGRDRVVGELPPLVHV
jgi:diguanylate cyclase (GGDEF)-like protein